MKKTFLTLAAISAGACSLFTACEDNHGPDSGTSGAGSYIISAAVDEVNSVLQAETLESGSLTTVNNGVETDSGTAWLFYGNSYLYCLQYNQGNAGVTTSFIMNADGAVEQRSRTYSIQRFTTYGAVGSNIVTVSAGDTDVKDASGNAAQGLVFNYLSVADQTNRTASIGCENYLGNGEYVTFAGLLELDGKIYTSVVPMGMSKYGVAYDGGSRVTYPDKVAKESGGQGSGAYEAGEIPTTQFPDNAWVAIYDNDTFSDPVIISTDKIGFAAGRNRSQYYQTIWAADNGDVYVFSPGYGRNHSTPYSVKGTLESGVVRIKSGATEFDPDYYYNIEDRSNGYAMFRCWHITRDYFLLQMYTGGTSEQDAIGGIGGGTNALAIFQGSTGEFRYVTEGLPAQDNITSIGSTPYCENGAIFVSLVTNDGSDPAVYKIDPVTATATKGVSVFCDSISAIGKLVPVQ